MDTTPTQTAEPKGRDGRGRFAKGNAGGPGNPHAAQVAQLRSRLLQVITSSDVEVAVKTMREVMKNKDARDGDRLRAAETLLERALGKPVELDLQERLDTLERTIAELLERDRP